MPSRLTFAIAAASALSLAACGQSADDLPPVEAPLTGATIGGDFTLMGEDRRPVSWSDFTGDYRIVYFGYTFCPDICPTDVQRAMAGLKRFEAENPSLGADIQPLFVTVDPERDTAAVVKEFTANFHPRLIGLTGTPEQIADAAEKFAIYYQREADGAGGGYLMGHTNITYLFDRDGKPLATLPTDIGADAVAAELEKWVR